MKEIRFGKSVISENGPCYVIAEIGHNHQGNLETALEMIRVAATCGVNAVKFQKRENRKLYTKTMYERPYDNENSYGPTYGAHREFLEFGWDAYVKLKKYAEEHNVELMCAPFDFESVDFLNKLGITSFKFASGDLTNIPLLTYAAKLGKPLFISTGAADMAEVRRAYEAVRKVNDQIVLLHCTCGYPTEYENLNLRVIETMKREFPDAIIGYSGHDNGVLAPVIGYMLGARVVEKHFTLNHAWKGTDHKFSLEPIGMTKQVRDLKRLVVSLGDGKKEFKPFEKDARLKMGKSLYLARPMKKGQALGREDIAIKSPGGGLAPYVLEEVVGKRLIADMNEETLLAWEHLEK